MNKIINRPEDVVQEYLTGLVAAHDDLLVLETEDRFVRRTQGPAPGKVGVISGGGSGCEPLHAGYVGHGMLTAACPGQIFTSPVPRQIASATRAADSGAGVLHVVKNFSGEVMNFGMATEILAFDEERIRIEAVIVGDDVSIPDSDDHAGRRGLGGTVAVEKIAGAAAERGDDLDAVTEIARRTASRARSLGVGLSSCTPPARGRPIFAMDEGRMEVGIGISGEPGREEASLCGAADLAELMVGEVLEDLAPQSGAPLLVLVSGMGATPGGELLLLYGEIDRQLRSRGQTPARKLVGNLVTALDQAGAALTLVELDPELTELWDAPVHTPALRWKA